MARLAFAANGRWKGRAKDEGIADGSDKDRRSEKNRRELKQHRVVSGQWSVVTGYGKFMEEVRQGLQ